MASSFRSWVRDRLHENLHPEAAMRISDQGTSNLYHVLRCVYFDLLLPKRLAKLAYHIRQQHWENPKCRRWWI
jgi:hypothetical protein